MSTAVDTVPRPSVNGFFLIDGIASVGTWRRSYGWTDPAKARKLLGVLCAHEVLALLGSLRPIGREAHREIHRLHVLRQVTDRNIIDASLGDLTHVFPRDPS